MADKIRRERWEVEQRLEFIEFRLFWDRSIRRGDLQEKFGISTPQASADLSRYRESAPGNMEYDASLKRYVPAIDFMPRYYRPNPDRYLGQLEALKGGMLVPEDTFLGYVPDIDILPVPHRSISLSILRKMVEAMQTRRSIRIQYQSMNDQRPDPTWRTISPHALGTDNMRWHVRAYCHLEGKHKDFIISRCLEVGELGEPHEAASNDPEWQNVFNIVLVPNPALAEAQRKTIELDYGMTNGQTVIPVRHALLYYFGKRMRLDVAAHADRPKETPVVINNRPEYDALLERLAT
tara:strand:- start:726 stop:1604 length:879 start_codon:yes stop_codon:yes gene_type:complete